MEMDEQPKKSGEEGGLMIKVATFIVDRRNLFFLLFGIALIFSVVSMNWTTVENALSAYLPETTETSRGLDRMEEQFITYGTAKEQSLKTLMSKFLDFYALPTRNLTGGLYL